MVASLANFYLTTWEEYHTGERIISYASFKCAEASTGQLYLGVFSGPVEGILMIVVIFIVTGVVGRCS